MRTAGKAKNAFTLLEVMVAVMIFFMCMFTILSLVYGSLTHIRALQKTTISPSSLAAQLSLTNKLTEGVMEGDFEDLYPDYRWTSETTETRTNGLFQVDFVITSKGGKPESQMSILLFRPLSPRGVGK